MRPFLKKIPSIDADLLITKASVEDAKSIVNFLNQVGGESDFLTFGLNEFPLSIEAEEQSILQTLTENGCLMLIGKIKDEIVAHLFLDISSQARLSHIATIGVSVSKKYWVILLAIL